MPLMSLNSKLLTQVEGGISYVNTNYPISGNGVNNPVGLAINPLTSIATSYPITGTGKVGEPIGLGTVPMYTVYTTGNISGDGSQTSPVGLKINPLTSVSTNNSISGNGTTSSPIGLSIKPLTTIKVDSNTLDGDGVNSNLSVKSVPATINKGYGLAGSNTTTDKLHVKIEAPFEIFKTNTSLTPEVTSSEISNNWFSRNFTIPTKPSYWNDDVSMLIYIKVGNIVIQRATGSDSKASVMKVSLDWKGTGNATTNLGYHNTAQNGSFQWITVGGFVACSTHMFTTVDISVYCSDNPIKVGDKVGIDVDFVAFPCYPRT